MTSKADTELVAEVLRKEEEDALSKELDAITKEYAPLIPPKTDYDKLKALGFDASIDGNFKEIASDVRRRTQKASNDMAKYEPILLRKAKRYDPRYPASELNPYYRELTDTEQIRLFFSTLLQAEYIGYDIETTGLKPIDSVILTHQFSDKANTAVLINDSVIKANPDLYQGLKNLLEGSPIKVIHNVKFEYSFLKSIGIKIANYFDTMIAAQYINEARSLGLKSLAMEELKLDMIEFDEVTYGSKQYDPTSRYAVQYACADADIALQLFERYRPIIDAGGTAVELTKTNKRYTDCFYKISMPLVKVLASMEEEGILINLGLLRHMDEEATPEIERLKTKLQEMAEDKDFNPDSAQQLDKLLYTKLKLKPLEQTKGGANSTSVKHLEIMLKEQPHEILKPLVDYSHISQFKSLYLQGIPKVYNPITCSVHTELKQAGTVTGRLSSANPNLQNLRKNQDD